MDMQTDSDVFKSPPGSPLLQTPLQSEEDTGHQSFNLKDDKVDYWLVTRATRVIQYHGRSTASTRCLLNSS